jgi:hypothetical protein
VEEAGRERDRLLRLAETVLEGGIREFNLSYAAFFKHAASIAGLRVIATEADESI